MPGSRILMADSDPTDTGGLFIGRRPGTGPTRYRQRPVYGGERRRLGDVTLAAGILVVETLLLVTLWGAQPAGWIWLGSQLNHASGSVSAGLCLTFLGMILTMVGTIWLAARLDHAWKLTRRAGGHEQKDGVLNRIFVVSGLLGWVAFEIWLWIGGNFIIPFMPSN